MRQHATERREEETEHEREERLQYAANCSQQRRTTEATLQTSTRHQYLHEKGWVTGSQLHEQPWVHKAMNKFHHNQQKLHHQLCNVCHEMWPTSTKSKSDFMCTRCNRDKGQPKRFSAENDMDPGPVPECLKNLSQIEEMLIANACPIMCIYRKHGGQRGYKGHVINFPQNVQTFLDKLPRCTHELPILIVHRQAAENTHRDFQVRRDRVLAALQWLKLNNLCYSDITIDLDSIANLPIDGVPTELMSVNVDDDDHDYDNDSQPSSADIDVQNDSRSFLPIPVTLDTEDRAIQSVIERTEWPDIGQTPLNEFELATMAFPTLFPYARGDPTYPGRQRPVSLTDALKHLMKYGEVADNNHRLWRFASHPRFPYWGLNMKQRHQLLSQANIYMQQHPEDANLTVEEMKTRIGQLSSDQLMKRLQRYAAKIQGSSQYWFQRYLELKALLEQMGPPTFFWTVSAADCHWPELHDLLTHRSNPPTHSDRIQAIIDQPHLTDWYFTSKLAVFLQYWLYDSLDADWHWYRLEYQSRGSTHAHGCAKLKNDPGICALVQKAAVAWLAAQDEENTTDCDAQRLFEEGEQAKATALQYIDWLVTTYNEALPDDFSSIPVPHPCSISPRDVTSEDEDYHQLVNTVQRHTHCSTAYCLRKKCGQQELKCRFDYPRPLQPFSTIKFEKLDNGTVRATLETKRMTHD